MESKTAVITGATGGLGSFVAQTMAGEGYSLALLDRHPARLASLVKTLGIPDQQVMAQSVDLLDPIQTESAANQITSKFGRLDVLIHLVGGWSGGKPLYETSPDDLELMLNQHVWTSFNVIKAFVPRMIKNNWGRVIMVSSPSATRPGSGSGAYAAGKSGQEALMLSLSQDLKGIGVTANLFQVKTIDTKREKVTAATPENISWTTPEELAAGILFLVSEKAGPVNGARIPLFGSY